MKICCPWPPSKLSPNARTHWRAKAAITKAYRANCYKLALVLAHGQHMAPDEIHLLFCPPDRRKRDDDNLVASFKAGRDGIAQALGFDDNRLRLVVEIGEPVTGGAVIVTLNNKTQAAGV